jgi:hypothetical protein
MWKNFSVFALRVFTSSGPIADDSFENPLAASPLPYQLHIPILGTALARPETAF